MKRFLFIFLMVFISCTKKSTNNNQTGDQSSSSTNRQTCSFERPPYIAKVNFTDNITSSLIFVGLHAKPDQVESELNLLDDVIEYLENSEGHSNIVGLGDFNADCSYLSENEFDQLDLNSKGYNWVISSEVDTNISGTHCAYDRIITHPSSNFSIINSGAITNSINNNISDHYPIYSTLNFESNEISFAAFNLHRYGPSKSTDSNFVAITKNLISNFDIVLLQEITTTDQSLPPLLIPDGYEMIISERLGSSSYKEQYAYVYNEKIEIVEEYVYQGEFNNCSLSNDQENDYTEVIDNTSNNSCTNDGYYCGLDLYIINNQCRSRNKYGENKRVRDCCCGI